MKNLTTADGGTVIAGDYSEPNGKSVLSFAQAQERAKAHRVGADRTFGMTPARGRLNSPPRLSRNVAVARRLQQRTGHDMPSAF